MPPHEEADQTIPTCRFRDQTAMAGAVAYRETHAAGNRANPQGCQAPSFREGYLMGPIPKARQSALMIFLSLIRATSLSASARQAPRPAIARHHALLPSRDGRFVARVRRAGS